MACGERYYAQFVVDDPGPWCDFNDVQSALYKLRLLRAALVQLWNKIVEVENQRGKWPWWAEWKDPLTQWMDRDQFPAKYGAAESLLYAERETFDRIRAVARDGVCLLDRMVTQAEQLYGGDVPNVDPAPEIHTPPPAPGPLDALGGAAAAVAIAVILILVSTSGGRRS